MRFEIEKMTGHACELLAVAIMVLSSVMPCLGEGNYIIRGLNHTAYIQQGDINIGALTSIYQSTDDVDVQCNKLSLSISSLQRLEAIVYAVELVNNDTSLLPNVSLGFVIIDDCNSINTALAQSLSFLPKTADSCPKDTCNSSSSSSSSPTSSLLQPGMSHDTADDDDALMHYDVIGVLSPGRSDRCVPISLLYSIAHIPMISHSASSDELSDKTKYRYFMRVIPPDFHQVQAMLSFIVEQGWSYISILYHEGAYGESAFNNFNKYTSDLGICLAMSHKVSDNCELKDAARELLDFPRARVVILFTNSRCVQRLMSEIQQLNAAGHFIWIGSDAWANNGYLPTPYVRELAGAFSFSPSVKSAPSFEKYFRGRKPSSSTNPWLIDVWEMSTGCSVANGTCDFTQDLPDVARDFSYSDGTSQVIDAVRTFAIAANQLISDLCPGAAGQEARQCVTGDTLLKYLLNTSFDGYSGLIKFDQNGDAKGKFQINQLIPERSGDGGFTGRLVGVPLAFYNILTQSIEYSDELNITWEFFDELERIVPLRNNESNEIPESVCSGPCKVGEYKIKKKLECCWECYRCRNNEHLVDDDSVNQGRCQVCPEFTWPDPHTNFTTCENIPVTHVSLSDTLSLVLLCLGLTGIIGTALVIAAYIFLRAARVIKAASRELSFIQLVAILVGYISVICFQTTPTQTTCSLLYFLFCLSFTWLYSPLLVKAIRIFRLFQSGTKFNRRPRFVSSMSQVIMAACLIALQVIICISISLTYKPTSRLTQPVRTEKFVELSCDMTLPGLCSFLAYNLVLVVLCSIFAFKTRKLPENFNESRFMSMCVSSTLVIWLAFIPTYLTATHEHTRVLLLSGALLLNHTVALVFLFLPKIYAAVYLPSEATEGNISNRLGNSFGVSASTTRPRANQVSPRGFIDPPRPGF